MTTPPPQSSSPSSSLLPIQGESNPAPEPKKEKDPNEDIAVSLQNEDRWVIMFEANNEMFLSRNACELRPILIFNVTKLDRNKKYSFEMKFNTLEKVDKKIKLVESNQVVHPAGSMRGSEWMRSGIDFGFIRISRDDSGSVQLNLNVTYLPVLTIYAEGVRVKTVSFPYTKFTTTSRYSTEELRELKKKECWKMDRKKRRIEKSAMKLNQQAHQAQTDVHPTVYLPNPFNYMPNAFFGSFPTPGPSTAASATSSSSMDRDQSSSKAPASFMIEDVLPELFDSTEGLWTRGSTSVVSSSGTAAAIDQNQNQLSEEEEEPVDVEN